MKLLVIVLCLLSERFLIHSLSYKRFIWFDDYCDKITQSSDKFRALNPWLQLLVFILPLVLIVSIIYYLLGGLFFGFIGLVLSLLIFYYCLGPLNPFYPLSENLDESPNAWVERYLVAVNSQLFALLFWYILLGPVVALLYRLITLCVKNPSVSNKARQLTELFEWVPARLTALLYLLVGNFQRGFSVFINYSVSKPALNHQILSECGILALQTNDANELSIAAAERLVEHAVIVLLVLIALFTLVAWL